MTTSTSLTTGSVDPTIWQTPVKNLAVPKSRTPCQMLKYVTKGCSETYVYYLSFSRYLELKLRPTGNQGLYLTICQSDFKNPGKCFVKLKYSLSSNMLKATHVFNEVDIFDREGAGWGYEEFFPLSWEEFKEHAKRTSLIITAQVRLLE